jgi:drug/metabolite transporter (DMT)-like permease
MLPVAAVACLDMALPTFLTAWGEERVSSSVAGILTATDPLFTALLALWLIRSEAVGRRRFAGLVVGFAGVVALLGLDFHGDARELAGAGAVLLAAAGFAGAALVYRRWLTGVPALAVTAAMAVLSTVVFAGPAAADVPPHPPPLASILALVALGTVNTGLAYWLFYLLIDEAGAATAGVITYVMPVVALVLGIAVLGESITAAAIAGMVLIAAGAWLATGGHARRRPARASGRPGQEGRHGEAGEVPRKDSPAAATEAAAQRRIGQRPPG